MQKGAVSVGIAALGGSQELSPAFLSGRFIAGAQCRLPPGMM